MSRSLSVAIKDHGGKAIKLAIALRDAGHRLVSEGRADVLLIDLDPPVFGYREMIDHYKGMGSKVLLYPHGAAPALEYDGLYEPYPSIDGRFVIGPGHSEFLRRIEYHAPAPAIGWSLSDMRPFRPRSDVRRVLFAPLHPSGFGTIADHQREANEETYARLLEGPWQLTVRHLGTLEQNGLWHADEVKFVQGAMDNTHREIDTTDVVVAGEGTFPSLAIARGVPTVIYAQTLPATYGTPGEEVKPLLRPERYRDYVRFPFDATDGPLDEILHAAAQSEEPIADWKRRFIGRPFDPQAFASLVERMVYELPSRPQIDETRSLTVAAFADELLERPELLAGFVDRYGPEDDASLIIWGPGLEADALLDAVQRVVGASGVDEDRLPDVLLLPLPGTTVVDRALAERADALLSEWPTAGQVGELPRWTALTPA